MNSCSVKNAFDLLMLNKGADTPSKEEYKETGKETYPLGTKEIGHLGREINSFLT